MARQENFKQSFSLPLLTSSLPWSVQCASAVCVNQTSRRGEIPDPIERSIFVLLAPALWLYMTLPPCDLSNVTSHITRILPFYKNIVSCSNKCVIEPVIKTIMTRWPNIQFYKIREYNKVTPDMGRSNRWGPFPRAWQTSKTVVPEDFGSCHQD